MRLMASAAMLALAGCHQRADTASTDDPGGQNVAAAAAAGVPAVQTTATDCSKKPDFVPVYADAQISLCTAGAGVKPNHESGTVAYTSAADPRTVLGWSRAQANASGLGQRLSTDTMYSAGEETKRSVMIIVEANGSGTKATVTWGRDF